ncbi:mitochondrial import inner membrane translocase subunit [Kwoniella heveanensis CBS 569]|uniref:Mitochondrial import inner membrane translocase subunit n=1 Tax=Kwoniella heveanensis BCC8398 TaxID=1296120 RepID=A0A1B9GHH8_9TREE|nr:mitochondrial import inner membrane translocase subunit [Kwoniella heveanensis BCC8398]OCF41566.1 mitochondrial import inner membrane translocase subunit [Kwoniella heveanensis CBS 569]
MSFLSGLFGSSKPEAEKEPSASADLFNSTTFRSNVNPSPSPSDASASSSSSSSSIPQPPSNASPVPAVSQPAPTALDAFSTSFDAARLHPLAGLSDNLELLQLDEDKLTEIEGAASVLPSRGWTDDLCVGTGTTYLSGLVLGGMWGAKEGLSRPLGNNPSFKLRINSILNGCTRRGSFTGNSLGVLAIFYNLANSSLDSVRGKHDAYNAMGAAALSGAIYKSSAGLRPALVGAGLMTAAAGGWSAFKTMV